MNAKWVFGHAAALAVAGLVVGVVAGWVGLLRADGAAAVSAAAAPLGYLVIAVAPIVLVVQVYRGAADPELAETFARPGALLGLLVLSAAIGAAAACALFLVTTTQIPAIFGGEHSEPLMRANRAAFGWNKLMLAVGITAVSALPAMLLGRGRAR